MDNERLALLFKALMHPARLDILDVLRNGEQCVCHIEAQLGYRQSYISQQLAVLREADLVRDERDGWNIYYYVSNSDVFTLMDAARLMLGITASSRNTVNPCPCPKCSANKT